MNATIEVEMNNAAFGDAPTLELARILRKLADDIEQSRELRDLPLLRDINGNTVGWIDVRT